MLLKPLRSGVEFLRSVHVQSRALQWFGLPTLSPFNDFTSCRPIYLVHRLWDQQVLRSVPCRERRVFSSAFDTTGFGRFTLSYSQRTPFDSPKRCIRPGGKFSTWSGRLSLPFSFRRHAYVLGSSGLHRSFAHVVSSSFVFFPFLRSFVRSFVCVCCFLFHFVRWCG